MSAYLCDAQTLAAIAREAAKIAGESDEMAEVLFSMLLDENLKSVGHRYPNAARISDWFDEGEGAFVWETIPETTHTATELLQMVGSYQYQSCEHPEWQTSNAKQFTDALKLALEPRAAEEAKAQAAEVARRQAAINALPTLYPKETAVAIRKLLKANYPATKFSVTVARGSMVSSVDIRWTDGPTVKAVDALVSCFEAGSFDSMTDCYNYDRDRALMIDGKAFRAGCRYVHTSRNISADLANRCIAQLVEYWGGIDNPPKAIQASGDGYEIADGRGRERMRSDLDHMHDWYTMIHQAAGDRTRFQLGA